eukprot:1196393-Prorocentrum_minimum.AAC.5
MSDWSAGEPDMARFRVPVGGAKEDGDDVNGEIDALAAIFAEHTREPVEQVLGHQQHLQILGAPRQLGNQKRRLHLKAERPQVSWLRETKTRHRGTEAPRHRGIDRAEGVRRTEESE